jgi:hypothetical protein
MAGQKERFTQPDREKGIYILEKFRENERRIKAIGDELYENTIHDRPVSNEIKERAKQLAAVEEALLDQVYTQAVEDNKAYERRAWIPGYKHRYKVYKVARAAGQVSKEIIRGYLDGVVSPAQSPLSQDIRHGAKKAGEWYRNKGRSGRYRPQNHSNT